MPDVLRLVVEDAQRGPRLSPALIEQLRDQLRSDTDSRVVVVEGGTEAFCEGLDLELLGGELLSGKDPAAVSNLKAFQHLLYELRRTPRPVIAVVDGPAMGGGVGLVAAADLVLASRRASFALPETLFGLIPGVIFPFVTERVGLGRARGLALGGQTLFAPRAYEWGLVDELCDDVAPACDRLVRRLVRQDAKAQAAFKDLVNRHFLHPEGYSDSAVDTFASLLGSEGTRTRLSRYASGRTPWPDVTG